MKTTRTEKDILDALDHARLVVVHAEQKGIVHGDLMFREPVNHIGAVLADAALQAGLNYNSVVRVRVDRIHRLFPEAATLSGVFASVKRIGVADFLLWYHPTKVARFIRLTELLREQGLEDVPDLRTWLQNPNSRPKLLAIKGIGPKTADYLGGLVGLDYIAVDRHIRTFASDAGVDVADYDSLQVIVSYAADLLGVSRRDFDASIWNYVSGRQALANQYQVI